MASSAPRALRVPLFAELAILHRLRHQSPSSTLPLHRSTTEMSECSSRNGRNASGDQRDDSRAVKVVARSVDLFSPGARACTCWCVNQLHPALHAFFRTCIKERRKSIKEGVGNANGSKLTRVRPQHTLILIATPTGRSAQTLRRAGPGAWSTALSRLRLGGVSACLCWFVNEQ